MLPKTETTGHLLILDRLLTAASLATKLIGIVESVRGLTAVEAIALATPRLAGIMLGAADMAADLGAATAWEPLAFTRARLVAACALAGVTATDAPYFDIRDPDGLEQEVARAVALGFRAKAAIHPRQIGAINTALTPTEETVERVRAILAENAKGVGTVDGQMTDEAVARKGAADSRGRGRRRLIGAPLFTPERRRDVMEQLLPAYKAVGERRYRDTSGLYYEDFEPSDVFEHRPGRTVLDVDNTWFTLLTMNIHGVTAWKTSRPSGTMAIVSGSSSTKVIPRSATPLRTSSRTAPWTPSLTRSSTAGLAMWYSAMMRGSKPVATDSIAATMTCPRCWSARSRMLRTEMRRSFSTRSATATNSRPAGVSCTRRVVRSNRLTPSTSSIRLMVRVKAGCDVFRKAAAAMKLP